MRSRTCGGIAVLDGDDARDAADELREPPEALLDLDPPLQLRGHEGLEPRHERVDRLEREDGDGPVMAPAIMGARRMLVNKPAR